MTELQKAVYEVLESSPAPLHVRDLYIAVKARVPHLCDDTVFPCPYCKQKHPLWQHKTAWALQFLRQANLVHSPKRGFWEVIERHIVEPPPPEPRGGEEPIHENLKTKLIEVGRLLGKWAREEYHAPPYIYDVIWKEVEGLPRPSHVFEVQDKGAVNGALSKLQHARDIWRPKLFLVVTGEKDRKKVESLLKPFLEGTFHSIRKDTTVLTPEEVDEIHGVLRTHKETFKEFLEL